MTFKRVVFVFPLQARDGINEIFLCPELAEVVVERNVFVKFNVGHVYDLPISVILDKLIQPFSLSFVWNIVVDIFNAGMFHPFRVGIGLAVGVSAQKYPVAAFAVEYDIAINNIFGRLGNHQSVSARTVLARTPVVINQVILELVIPTDFVKDAGYDTLEKFTEWVTGQKPGAKPAVRGNLNSGIRRAGGTFTVVVTGGSNNNYFSLGGMVPSRSVQIDEWR